MSHAISAPPMGVTGLSFANALQNRLPGKSVRVEAIDYAASSDFGDRLQFAGTVVKGIDAAKNRVESIAAHCPQTKIVLGGYSQGAALVGYLTNGSFAIPAKYSAYAKYAPSPLSPTAASHVAAVIEFAPPSSRFLRDIGAPPITPAAAFRGKIDRYCIAGDTICDGAPAGPPNPLHLLYSVNDMPARAANFVAGRV